MEGLKHLTIEELTNLANKHGEFNQCAQHLHMRGMGEIIREELPKLLNGLSEEALKEFQEMTKAETEHISKCVFCKAIVEHKNGE